MILFVQLDMSVLADQIKPQSNIRTTKQTRPLEVYQKIKTAPTDFPDLPIFPGKTQFLDGYYLPNKNGASICQMSYMAREDSAQVLDFYKDAFSGNGWKIQFAAGPTITARHNNGHVCSVNVMKSKLPKMKSQFTIAYRQLTK